MGVKADDVQWCPTTEDVFLTWGTDIQLYQTKKVAQPIEKMSLQAGYLPLSRHLTAHHVCTTTEFTRIKCVAWCNGLVLDGARLLAIGQGNGSIRVTSISSLIGEMTYHHNREYVSRGSRCVNSLSWSDGDDFRLLLAAMDRSGRDASLMLYDATRLPTMHREPISTTTATTNSSSSRHQGSASHDRSAPHDRPAVSSIVAEFCNSELVHSAVFTRQSRATVAATTQSKYLKVLDIRDGKLASSVNTKAVYGLCCDPYSQHRLASYLDSQLYVWDLRQLNIPVLTMAAPRRVIKLQWCPTRSGFLGCLSYESPTVRLFDLQYAGRDLLEASVTVLNAATPGTTNLTSFSWHPTRYNTLLTANTAGILCEHQVRERVTVNWSCRGDIMYSVDGLNDSDQDLPFSAAVSTTSSSSSQDQQPQQLPLFPPAGADILPFCPTTAVSRGGPPNPGKLYRVCAADWDGGDAGLLMEKLLGDDVSRLMCKRALAGYGVQGRENVAENGAVLERSGGGSPASVAALRNMWWWLGRAQGLTRTGVKLRTGHSYCYHGLMFILSQSGSRSDIHNAPWSGLGSEAGAGQHTTRVFRSEERRLCLQLMSWYPIIPGAISSAVSSGGNDSRWTLDEAIEVALGRRQHARAAALAVFQLQLPRAVEILRAAAEEGTGEYAQTMSSVAMALAGYSGERKALWRETCAAVRRSLREPHLRAMFAFLTGDADSYGPVLTCGDLNVFDRIGFALVFLSDAALLEYLQGLQRDLAPHGDLQGLAIAGLQSEGVSLLQAYVDHTSDVQTAALLSVHGFSHSAHIDHRLYVWQESYQELLSSQQLWSQRAQLTVLQPSMAPVDGVSPLPYLPEPPQPPPNVLLACKYCKNSIAAPHLALPSHSPPKNALARLPQSTQQQQNKSKVLACPSCRKPLPRCALCLQRLGTPSHSPALHNRHHKHKEDKPGTPESPNAPHHLFIPAHTQARLCDNLPGLNPFSNWFTWCQTCRHGGHAGHILDWFREHSECPVTGCSCQCLLQDTITQPHQQQQQRVPSPPPPPPLTAGGS